MNILDLFPTPVGLHNLGRELTEEEIAILNNIKENTRPNGGGNLTSINATILEIDDLLNLKSVLTKYVNDYFKQVFNPNSEMELYITQSWLNVNDNGTGHHPHSHHNSLVSCVYYVDSYNGDEIAFKNPNEFLGNFKINSDNPGRWCVNDLKIPVFKNHLLLQINLIEATAISKVIFVGFFPSTKCLFNGEHGKLGQLLGILRLRFG